MQRQALLGVASSAVQTRETESYFNFFTQETHDMSDPRPVATFTARGWIKDNTAEKTDFILANFFEAVPSQTWLMRRRVKSVQSILAEHSTDPEAFCEALQAALLVEFNDYFETVVINVQIDNPEQYRIDGKADIRVSITIKDDKEGLVNVARQFREIDSVFKVVVNEVNYGSKK